MTKREGGIFVGRLSEEKGIRELVHTWAGIDYPLHIVGDGPLSDELSTTAGKNIQFHGRLSREEVTTLMSQCSFLIVPSKWYKSFGLVVIEAFSCGLPVLCSNKGALPELVEPGQTGWIFPSDELTIMKEVILWAIDHPSEMLKMGQNARSIYLQKHTPEVNYVALIDIYERATFLGSARS